MSSALALPIYSKEELARLAPPELIDLLIRDEDRVSLDLIEECARRGDATIECLRHVLDDDRCWREATLGRWWLLLHAVMILGLIPGEGAGLLLVDFMRRMAQEDDDNLQGWLAGYWPTLFRNKPESVLSPLRAVCKDRELDWYIRANAVDAVVAAGQHEGERGLESALHWLMAIASDEQEVWEMRLCVGNTLLDFPRAAYRPLLEALAARQSGWDRHFSKEDIGDAYAAAEDQPEWDSRRDPWEFYTPASIERRQQRWKEEDTRSKERKQDVEALAEPQPVRSGPKIGRNDPCHCGSGKKYKKCCLSKDEG